MSNTALYKFKLKNRFSVVLVVDKAEEEWYILSENHSQYIKGKLPDRLERTHLPFCIRNNEYSLVLDPSEDGTGWNTWSVIDEKTQAYLEIGGSL